jgi:D-proline reductase (dithiol) PrdB
VGLIARQVEAAGIATVCLSSALSITEAVRPPRAVFVDFPLGHTAGRPHDPALQRAIVRDALRAFETLREPGGVVRLPYAWGADDAWKEGVLRPRPEAAAAGAPGADERSARVGVPQYQCERDRELAEAALASGGCPTCVFLES